MPVTLGLILSGLIGSKGPIGSLLGPPPDGVTAAGCCFVRGLMMTLDGWDDTCPIDMCLEARDSCRHASRLAVLIAAAGMRVWPS